MKNLPRFAALAFAALLLSSALHAAPRGRMADIFREAEQHASQESCPGQLESVLESVQASIPAALDTERFELRPLTMDNLEEILPIMTNPDVARMSGDYLDRYTMMSILGMGREYFPAQPTYMHMVNFGIREKSTGRLVGMSQLVVTRPSHAAQKGLVKNPSAWFEVSYHLDPSTWGKGVATEVARSTTAFAFNTLGAEGIHGHTIASNDGSGKVLMKLGMQAIHSDANDVYYAATAEQYRAYHAARQGGAATNPPVAELQPHDVQLRTARFRTNYQATQAIYPNTYHVSSAHPPLVRAVASGADVVHPTEPLRQGEDTVSYYLMPRMIEVPQGVALPRLNAYFPYQWREVDGDGDWASNYKSYKLRARPEAYGEVILGMLSEETPQGNGPQEALIERLMAIIHQYEEFADGSSRLEGFTELKNGQRRRLRPIVTELLPKAHEMRTARDVLRFLDDRL